MAEQTNILTIDTEDWYQGCRCYFGLESGTINGQAFRRGLDRLLDLLARRRTIATFFLLGMTIECDPGAVDAIQAGGHEIATHGYGHRHLWRMTPAEFREDLKRGLGVLAGRVQQPVLGYRAPQFSVPPGWMDEFFSALAEAGLRYDCSIFPFRGRRYGTPGAPREVHVRQTPAGPIIEVPATIRRLFGRALPVAGGGYWRLLPLGLIRSNIRAANRDGLPMVTYMHNYEFDPQFLSVRGANVPGTLRRLKFNLTQNLGRGSIYGKLDRLLEEFRFTSVSNHLAATGHLA